MKGFLIRILGVAVPLCVLVGGAALTPEQASSNTPLANKVLSNALEVSLGRTKTYSSKMPISAAVSQMLLEQTGELNRRAARLGYSPPRIELPRSSGCDTVFQGNGQVNVRVNQDCSLRQQPGTAVAVDPLDPGRVLVAQNDSRNGFNHCGVAWSSDGGLTWGDQTPPYWQFTLMDGKTADGCVDPSVAWDSQGNSYVAATLNDVGSNAPPNAIVVSKSNAGIGGAFFHSPDPHGGFQEYRSLPLGVPTNLNDPNIALDKPMISADSSAASPKRDNLYLTWTRYGPEQESADGPEGIRAVSPIFFSQSTDHGVTWTLPIEINGRNFDICPTFECYNDQGSDTVIGPDGSIYAAFANRDSPNLAEQLLFVKCPVAGWCDERASWATPVRVAYIDSSHPTGPSDNGCPFGRQCLPPNGYTVNEAMSISASVDSTGNLFIVWSDFRNNTNPNCRGNAETATPPCDNDVFYSYSTDGGTTWSEPISITPQVEPALRRDRPVAAMERDGSERAPLGRVLRPLVRRLRVHRLQRRDRCRDHEPGERLSDVRVPPRDDGVDAEPDGGEQPDRGGLHRRSDADRDRLREPSARRVDGHAPARGLGARGGRLLRAGSGAVPGSAAGASPSSATGSSSAAATASTSGRSARSAAAAPPPPVRCRVPRVVGLRLGTAKTRIRRANCAVRAVKRVRRARAVGKVVSQSPRAGTVRARGYGLRLAVGRR